MSRDAIVSRRVIHDRFLSPSMATKTLAAGSKGPVLNRYKITMSNGTIAVKSNTVIERMFFFIADYKKYPLGAD
ncbi:MAG: hypothetical protein K0A94_01320 [Desulfuromonadales bacterium]|nr:hypothetical protein [Desulfuromonadales bacterium]